MSKRIKLEPQGSRVYGNFLENRKLCVTFSTDSRFIAFGDSDGIIEVWTISPHVRYTKLKVFYSVYCLAFSNDGKYLAAGLSNGATVIWKVATRRRIARQVLHERGVWGIAFSPDDRFLASVSFADKVCVQKVPNGDLVHTLVNPSYGTCIAYAPDGTIVAGSPLMELLFWNTQSDTRQVQPVKTTIYGVAFSQDGQLMVTGGGSRIDIWKGRDCIQTIQEHDGDITCVAFSPTNRFVASGSKDHTVRIWEVNTGKCVHMLRTEPWCYSVAFSLDGYWFACCIDEGNVFLCKLDDIPAFKLESVVISGLASRHPFFVKGLYDPRLLCHVRNFL